MYRLAALLAACTLGLPGCSLGLSGFVCSSDSSCGGDRKCIDRSCAAPDPLCASGYHWEGSSGARSGTCTLNVSDGGVIVAVPAVNDLAVVVSSCSQVADGTSCGTGQICRAMSCVAGCLIAGTFYAPGTLNPANVCQQCDPLQSPSAWSPAAAGSSCAGGRCVAGACCTGCVTAAGSCQATATIANCGTGGAMCTSCASNSDCITDVCNSDGTCGHTALAGNPCAGAACAQGAMCPGACAQCSDVGVCSAGQCTQVMLTCCPSQLICSVSNGRARCHGD
jgi:hypothetical protein